MTQPIALITGGSRGLGRNAALKLAEGGTSVILTYRSKRAEAEQVVADIESRGAKAVALQLDVGDTATFGSFAGQLRTALTEMWQRDTIEYLINNAGMGLYGSFAETTEDQFDELMRVHLKGPFFLTQILLPFIADGGRILNVSSGLTRFSLPGFAAYATMKGGIEVLTKYMAKELGPRGIAVNVIAPGAVETDFGGGRVRDDKDMNDFIAAQTTMGRVGLPDDIGGAIAALLSKEAGWITAQRIEASGGMFL